MLPWRMTFRALYVVLAPICILAIVVNSTSFLFNLLCPRDSLRDKITGAARTFVFDRRFGQDDRTMTTFNGYFYVATRTIAKGETIKAADLERESYYFEGQPGPGLILSKQGVVSRTAAKNIAKDGLVVAADLVPIDGSQKRTIDLDNGVITAGSRREMSRQLQVLACLLLGTGALAYGYGYVGLAVLAFRKSLIWGLSCIFIPFAAVVFKLQNWSRTRRYFHALLIGFTLIIFGGMLFLVYIEAPLSW